MNIRNGTRSSTKWLRADHLPKGHRFYSSAEWVRWMEGIPAPMSQAEKEYQLSLPELPSKFYLLDLDDDTPHPGRYMSLTARLHRYWEIYHIFGDIVSGRLVPTNYPRARGRPVFLPNHGPTADWLKRARTIWDNLPANDSEIFDRPAETKKPKNRHLAERLAPLPQWARIKKPLSLNGTNWLQADNDSYFDGEEPAQKPASNRERRIRPGSTDAELKSFIKKAGPCSVWKHAKFDGGGEWELMPTDHAWPARAGKLRIANGKTEAEGVRVPKGTILYQPDKFGELLGPEPDPDEKARSLSYWNSLMSYDADTASCRLLEPIRHIKAGRIRRKVKITAEEQAELLAGPLPPVTYCKPGLPCGHEDIGAQFVGGWVSHTKGKAGVERWEDVSDEISRQDEFERWAKALPPEQQKALNVACTAANFEEIGEAFGKQGKNAERYGKKVLQAANDNLKTVIAA